MWDVRSPTSQRNKVIQSMYREDAGRCVLSLPVNQHRAQPGFLRTFHVVSQTVTDMHGFSRLNGVLLERQLENLRGWLGGMGETGDRNGIKELGDAQSPQDAEESRVKVGHDAELKARPPQRTQNRRHFREQLPGAWVGKDLIHV